MTSLASQIALGTSLPLPSKAGITGGQSHSPSMYVGSRGLNFGPQAFMAGSLVIEPSPQHSHSNLKSKTPA